jgi:hypothetical protein
MSDQVLIFGLEHLGSMMPGIRRDVYSTTILQPMWEHGTRFVLTQAVLLLNGSFDVCIPTALHSLVILGKLFVFNQ